VPLGTREPTECTPPDRGNEDKESPTYAHPQSFFRARTYAHGIVGDGLINRLPPLFECDYRPASAPRRMSVPYPAAEKCASEADLPPPSRSYKRAAVSHCGPLQRGLEERGFLRRVVGSGLRYR
jgi:hypothetical protein